MKLVLYHIEIPVTFPEERHAHPAMGSIFHGALMERFPPEVANAFHQDGMRLYSQSILWNEKKNTSLWRIGALNDEVAAVFLDALQTSPELYLKQQGYAVHLGPVSCRKQTFDQLLHFKKKPKGAEVVFLTTTSFKRQGSYVLFPELPLLYQSVLLRWPMMTSMPMEPETAQVLGYYTVIRQYDLHTALFHLEGRSVPGFAGRLGIRFCGNRDVNCLAATLLQCAVYTGIGIKTALGMGAVRVRIFE